MLTFHTYLCRDESRLHSFSTVFINFLKAATDPDGGLDSPKKNSPFHLPKHRRLMSVILAGWLSDKIGAEKPSSLHHWRWFLVAHC